MEIAVVLLIAFAVFGPQRMVDIARKLGRFVRQVSKISAEVTRTISEENPEAKGAVHDFRKAGSDLRRTLTDALEPAQDAANAAAHSPSQSVPVPDNAAQTAPSTVIAPTPPPEAKPTSSEVPKDTVEGKLH